MAYNPMYSSNLHAQALYAALNNRSGLPLRPYDVPNGVSTGCDAYADMRRYNDYNHWGTAPTYGVTMMGNNYDERLQNSQRDRQGQGVGGNARYAPQTYGQPNPPRRSALQYTGIPGSYPNERRRSQPMGSQTSFDYQRPNMSAYCPQPPVNSRRAQQQQQQQAYPGFGSDRTAGSSYNDYLYDTEGPRIRNQQSYSEPAPFDGRSGVRSASYGQPCADSPYRYRRS